MSDLTDPCGSTAGRAVSTHWSALLLRPPRRWKRRTPRPSPSQVIVWVSEGSSSRRWCRPHRGRALTRSVAPPGGPPRADPGRPGPPGVHVMDLAPGERSIAVLLGALGVAQGEGPALRLGEQPGPSPEVEGDGVAAEDHRDDARAGSQSAHLAGRHLDPRVGEAGSVGLTAQGLQGGGHQHRDVGPTAQLVGGQVVDQLAEGLALLVGPVDLPVLPREVLPPGCLWPRSLDWGPVRRVLARQSPRCHERIEHLAEHVALERGEGEPPVDGAVAVVAHPEGRGLPRLLLLSAHALVLVAVHHGLRHAQLSQDAASRPAQRTRSQSLGLADEHLLGPES